MSGFFHSKLHLRDLSMCLQAEVACPFSWLCGILLCDYTTIYWSFSLLSPWVASRFWYYEHSCHGHSAQVLWWTVVVQSCPTLWDHIDCSMPGFPVLHYLLEFAQTHVHWVDDAIQSSHPVAPFSSCPQSFPTSGSFPMKQLFASGGQSSGASALASVLPMNIPLGLTGLIFVVDRWMHLCRVYIHEWSIVWLHV